FLGTLGGFVKRDRSQYEKFVRGLQEERRDARLFHFAANDQRVSRARVAQFAAGVDIADDAFTPDKTVLAALAFGVLEPALADLFVKTALKHTGDHHQRGVAVIVELDAL